MRLAFQNGQAHIPRTFQPAVYLQGFGVGDTAFNPSIVASSAVTGASTATMLGGSTNADIVGGVQAGLETTAGVLATIPGVDIAAPFIAAVAGLIGPVASMFKGCGATCTQTTQIANAVESATGQITNSYWAQPVRTTSMQQAAVTALQQLYSYLISNCQKIGGQGGKQCVADRQPGGKYDYQAQQILPIQNDTAVVADPAGTVSSVLSGFPTPLLLVAAGFLIVFGMGK